MQVDLAMPTNLTDPASKMKYFQAATMLSKAAAVGTDVNNIAPVPFFENVFPDWAGVTGNQLSSQGINCAPGNFPATPTATQAIERRWLIRHSADIWFRYCFKRIFSRNCCCNP